MLSYALAIAVAISSLTLFSTAFLMSKIHRQDDFLWSAVGLFYALILWFCARNITGTVLLGQAAATVLITSYCWQTIKLRQAIANPDRAAETSNFSLMRRINSLFKRKPKLESTAAPIVKPPTPKVTEQAIAIPETPTEVSPTSETTTELVENKPPIADSPSTQVAKPIQNQVDSSEQLAESQPLPNKLPETVKTAASPEAQLVEKPSTETEIPTVAPTTKAEEQNTVAKTPAVALTPQTPKDLETKTAEVTENISQTEDESEPEVKTESDFDSLEVVEVAEVLEAEIDDGSNPRESATDSIIEVTTTEINIVAESQGVEENSSDNFDS
ncbi:MAG: Ycf66 family protein [Cyanobacteria bacterium J06600_6]